ncbi:MAG: hypothetical protein HQ581_05975 [Planctomycetes bacterium]|nr:hypothetical protein [Planctomycetota bacterium]
MYIYVIDTRSPFSGKGWHWPWTTVESLKVNGKDSVSAIVTRISKLAKEKIDCLLLCAHGNTGYLQLGKEGLTANNAHVLRSLKGKFADDAKGIEVHGCGVGSDTNILKGHDKKNNAVCKPGTSGGGNGFKFLKALATAAKAKATGALNCQYDDASFSFEGPTITAKP